MYMQFRFAATTNGRLEYIAGKPLSANPWKIGTVFARLWADAWLNAWMAQPSA